MVNWQPDPKRPPAVGPNGDVSTFELSPDSPGVVRVTVRQPSRRGIPSHVYYATPDGRRWDRLAAARRAVVAPC